MFGVVWWYSNSQVVLAMNMILKTVVVGRLMENTYIVASEDTKECVIIDPGDEGARILYEVNGLGLKVKLILNTHGHSDHTGAVEFIRDATGAKYGIHQGDVHMLCHSRNVDETLEHNRSCAELKDCRAGDFCKQVLFDN